MSKDNPYQGYHAQLLEKLERLKCENAALREVLAFYADPQSYGINGGNFHRVASDHGTKARAALARKEAQPWGDDQIMRQHLSEGGTPT